MNTKRTLKIGIFTDTYSPQINGIVTSVVTLKAELERRGHTVYVFTAKDPASQKQARVYRLPSLPFVFEPQLRAAYVYPPRLLYKIRKLELDIVHTHTEFSVGVLGKLVAEFIGKPYIHTYHTKYEDYAHYIINGRIVRKIARQFSSFFCNRADVVVAPVASTRDSLVSYGVSRTIEVVPTGLDFRPFVEAVEEERLREELGIPQDARVVLFVGRVAKEKSIDVLIQAMPKLLECVPEAVLVVIGNGPIIGQLTGLADELGVARAVKFLGGRPHSSIPRYYKLGDVFATASTSETQGLTYYEAMASGLVVVAKKDGSNDGVLVDGENSYVFQEDQELPQVLAKALLEEAGHIRARAMETIRPLSSEIFGQAMEEIYFRAMGDAKKGSRGRIWSGIADKRRYIEKIYNKLGDIKLPGTKN